MSPWVSTEKIGNSEKMTQKRTLRRVYYNLFSHLYDAFVSLHARRNAGDTRNFLVKRARLEEKSHPYILDICCGTGAVTAAFATQYPQSFTVGYDFSRGMLLKGREKSFSRPIILIEGDAATLPFMDQSFDVITCLELVYSLLIYSLRPLHFCNCSIAKLPKWNGVAELIKSVTNLYHCI